MQIQNSSGYSILVSIFMVGFLLIITSGVFHLVLSELNDNRGRENYIQASAGAEGALELALLSIKEKGYGYYDTIDISINNRSIMLAGDPLDSGNFKKNDTLISYDMDSKVESYTGSLAELGFDIIPLFYIDEMGDEQKIQDLVLDIPNGASGMSWNIISDNGGVSGIGNVSGSSTVSVKEFAVGGFQITNTSLGNFLSHASRTNNYLILFNSSSTDTVEYFLDTPNPGEYFTKPRAEIISSAKVGDYKQNFRTIVDNTEYLNVLKYSVFSN